MMRAFEARADTWVSDEPLYGHYLKQTGLEHPGAQDVIASQSTDWRTLTQGLVGSVPSDRTLWYQKHMSHHLLPGFDLEWTVGLTNCFLIRPPDQVLTSYSRTRKEVTLSDLGYVQQGKLFQFLSGRLGYHPPILDARDVLGNPGGMLKSLCREIGTEFDSQMLEWATGPRETYGVWGKHWYANVWNSTGFQPYEKKEIRYDSRYQPIVDAAQPIYEALYARRLTPPD